MFIIKSMQATNTIQITASLQHIAQTAQQVLDFAAGVGVFFLEGMPGAGKTTLIKSICASLGYQGIVQSPTFNLINSYDLPQGQLHHFDFYRLNSLNEIADLGVADYLHSNEPCFIEWGEPLRPHMHQPYVLVHIAPHPQGRTYTLEKYHTT